MLLLIFNRYLIHPSLALKHYTPWPTAAAQQQINTPFLTAFLVLFIVRSFKHIHQVFIIPYFFIPNIIYIFPFYMLVKKMSASI